jgi:hypothetical protein
MKLDISIKDLLQIENSPEIFSIFCPETGIPLWSVLRGRLHRLILGDLLYGKPFLDGWNVEGTGSKSSMIAAVSKSFIYNAVKLQSIRQHYPVLLMATGARLIKTDGLYFNCLSDHFMSAAPQHTMAVEDLFNWRWPFPRIHENVLLQTPLRVHGVLRGRLRERSFREPARALVDVALRRAQDYCDWTPNRSTKHALDAYVENRAGSLLPRYEMYLSVFKKLGTRLLIKEEATYGGADNAAAIIAARHLGLSVAEYQHGSLSKGHNAYNFSDIAISNKIFLQTMPDCLLVFGSWWGAQINAPFKKVVIGNPHRSEMLINMSTSATNQEKKVLILGDGHETKLYLTICEQLASKLGRKFEIIFRPHPLERQRVIADHAGAFTGNVRLDTHQDIYHSFRQVEVVVSEVSTGLFEAIGLVPRIFLLNTPKSSFAFPEHPFKAIADTNDLASNILDENSGRVVGQQIDSIWAPHWKKSYLEFISQMVPR